MKKRYRVDVPIYTSGRDWKEMKKSKHSLTKSLTIKRS